MLTRPTEVGTGQGAHGRLLAHRVKSKAARSAPASRRAKHSFGRVARPSRKLVSRCSLGVRSTLNAYTDWEVVSVRVYEFRG